nr:type II toxin-antitoxin system RelE/ParE family toxin [Eubacterium sp.]
MANEYFVKITEYAQGQMRGILQYIANELDNPDAARHTLDTLEESICSLSQLPERFALTEEEPWRSFGVHKLMVKNFLVYYWIDKEQNIVQVTAIVYYKRNQKSQLEQMKWE